MSDLRFPIGEFPFVKDTTAETRAVWLNEIEVAPSDLREVVNVLSDQQLDTPYRPDGWTVRQVVHHLADSHINSYTRFRLAMTEENPTIRPYEEARWAELSDGRDAPIDYSLSLLDALHARWILLLRSMQPEDFERTFQHPELGSLTLDTNLAFYAWHGKHHIAHITGLIEREGW